MWRMKPDLTTKAILAVIALLLGAIAVKVYVFPSEKVQKGATASPIQLFSEASQQTQPTAPGSPKPSSGPSKSEASAAVTEFEDAASGFGDAKATVHDLKCRGAGESFDCQVYFTLLLDNDKVSSQITDGFIFTKLGGKWRATIRGR